MATKKQLAMLTEDITPAKQPRVVTNTITFSSDMESLFIVDDGKASSFNLSHPNGVIVGTLRGQVVAGTAESAPDDSEVLQKVVISLQRAQWTAFYRRPTQTLNVIGATDIDLGLMADKEGKATVHRFLIGGNAVHLHRSGNTLTISLIKS